MANNQEMIQAYAARSAAVIESLGEQADIIEQIGQAILTAFTKGNKLLTMGNGGSAAEAMHLGEELTGKYFQVRQALPALCLNADVTAITCIANDWDFASIFSRQVEALGKPGDVLVCFSTSGNSANLTNALETARKMGIATVGLLGKDGGAAKALSDICLIVKSKQGNHVQEAHQAILHILLEMIDGVYVKGE